MDLPVWALVFVTVIFSFTFSVFDVQKNMEMKHDVFESVRAANQNALLDVQDKYDEFEELSTPEMVNEWLINFINNNGLEYKDITLTFNQIEAEPPLFLVTVEGEMNRGYFVANKNATMKYYSAATIVEMEEREEE